MTMSEKLKEIAEQYNNEFEMFNAENGTVIQYYPEFGVIEEWIFNEAGEAVEAFLYVANTPQGNLIEKIF